MALAASPSFDVFWHPSEEGSATSILHTGKDDFVWSKLPTCMKNVSSTSLSRFCQHLLWPRAALFPHKILIELLQPLFSITFVHLWKGHKLSHIEYRYFKGKGNLDFSTMGIFTCTASQYNEHIQEKWLKFSHLKLGSVLSTKHARVFHGCHLASTFALPILSWIKLQAQCSLNTYTQRYKLFSWHALELRNSDLSFIYSLHTEFLAFEQLTPHENVLSI